VIGGRFGSLGALVERDYRLLFAATSISSFGDMVAIVALAFAVLEFGDASDLGLVLASRQAASAAMLIFGAVLSDRLPRNRVLVGASLLQGVSQAAIATTVLTGDATVLSFAVLGVLWGLGDGLVLPAEVGLVPQTVSAARLQQANALQGLSRGAVRILGPAVGGVLVVALSPGWALAVDSLTFFACAALLARIRLVPREATERRPYLRELRDGWQEFTSRTWLWSTVLVFGVGNLFFQFSTVLGPAIAEDRLGGAGAWAAILSAGGVGSLAGGLFALRHRPARPLVASILWSVTIVFMLVALALEAPVEVVAATSFVFGFGIALHVTLWFTVFQREVPEHAQSRVSSYDALGSVIFVPLGSAIAGPVALAIGTSAALWLAAAVIAGGTAAMLTIPAVWRIRADSGVQLTDRPTPVVP
jgi:MFS family permease